MGFKVSIKDLKAGRTFQIEVEPTDSVAAVKEKIKAQENVEGVQRLVFRGKTLQDGQTVAQAGFQEGATLHLIMRLQSSLTFDVRTMRGSTVTIDVQPSETVDRVNTMVGELLRMAAAEHCLNLRGKRLEGHRTLADCDVRNASVLHWIRIPMAAGLQPSPRRGTAELGDPSEVTQDHGRIRVYGDLGTLYARCGGIFGVSGFVDRCMDKWMADATLNSNAAVATWHQRAQRCGFKFLVTQLMGCIAGGPQRYTGRSMADSHKHLNISPGEWSVFMLIFHAVCREFNLPQVETDDLAAILSSMEADCVLQEGETAPPNPGHQPPPGESLYASLGGVYPIALFVDRLVDALLADKRVNVPVDGQKRNEASLKYLLTEVVCAAAGGPESITSVKFPETRLLLPDRKMFFVLEASKAASDHIESADDRKALIYLLHQVSHIIVDPARMTPPSANQRERQQRVQQLGEETGVPLLYIPRGGVVKFDFDASPGQMERVARGLGELGFRVVEKTKVKSAGEAASGNMLSAETIASRYAAPSSFVAARMRVFGDPRTLYGRGGGIFGLAKLSDRLMDVWMSDRTLNENSMVARWHTSQQKFGFKFLVTQIFGYLTGGPQRYTGQPMDVSHKHLGISMAEWRSFMAGLDRVMREFQIDAGTQRDLTAIFDSLRDQIIVREGEAVPADPGLCRRAPSGPTLYAQAGGVYPLAQFADLLVVQSLQGNRGVHIPRDPTNKRTPAGLKYLVTELVCAGAGGPQVVTSMGFDDAKLGVRVEEWPAFLELVRETAADCWSSVDIQRSIRAVIEEQQPEICMGLATEEQSADAVGRRRLMGAGYGHVESTAALDRCRGDVDAALELLASGWAPEASAPAVPGDPPRCPFSGASAAAAAPAGARASSGAQAFRVLGNSMQEELDQILIEDPNLICPITMLLMLDPVIASDGCVYERVAIAELQRIGGVSPVTRAPLSGKLLDAPDHQANVHAFMRERSRELLRFADKAFHKGRERTMAMTALDRVRDYVSALTAHAAPDLAADFADLCRQLDRPAELSDPQERVQRLLKSQVAQAKMEAEVVLGRAVPGSKVVAFCIDRSWQPIVGPSIRAISEIFQETLDGYDQVGLYQLGGPWIFELVEKSVKEDDLRQAIAAAEVTGGTTALYRSMRTCVEALEQNLAQAPGAEPWLIVLTDTVDIDDSVFEQDGQTMDPELKRRLQKAGARVGQVTVSLMWHTKDDLDLHVVCPCGSEIKFNTKKAGGGWLDVDMNPRHETDEPVENVFWDTCPPGRYQVFVENYSYATGNNGPIPFTLTLRTKVEAKGVTEFGKVWGMCTWTGACTGTKGASRVNFSFEIPPGGVERAADTKVLDEVCASVARLAGSRLHLCLIDSRQISGWQPENPRWPEWRGNVDHIMRSCIGAGGEAFHLSAANEAEIAEKFGDIAEMMTD